MLIVSAPLADRAQWVYAMSSSAPNFTIFRFCRFSLLFILVSLPFILFLRPLFHQHYLPGFCARLELDFAFLSGNFLLLARRATSSSRRRFFPRTMCAVLSKMWWFFVFRRLPAAIGCHFDGKTQQTRKTRDRKLSCRGNLIFLCWATGVSAHSHFFGQCIGCFFSGIVVRTCSNGKRIDAALEVQLKKW